MSLAGGNGPSPLHRVVRIEKTPITAPDDPYPVRLTALLPSPSCETPPRRKHVSSCRDSGESRTLQYARPVSRECRTQTDGTRVSREDHVTPTLTCVTAWTLGTGSPATTHANIIPDQSSDRKTLVGAPTDQPTALSSSRSKREQPRSTDDTSDSAQRPTASASDVETIRSSSLRPRRPRTKSQPTNRRLHRPCGVTSSSEPARSAHTPGPDTPSKTEDHRSAATAGPKPSGTPLPSAHQERQPGREQLPLVVRGAVQGRRQVGLGCVLPELSGARWATETETARPKASANGIGQ